MIRTKTIRAELGSTLRLALPLVLAELGWMSMTIVDTMMVGRLPNSATAMGAVSLGSNLFTAIALFGGGLLMGLDTLVSQAFGAGRREDCHRSLVNSVYLSIALTPLLAIPVWILPVLLRAMRVDAEVLALAIPYTKALLVGLFTANIVNALGNWTLIYGKFGMPAMGAIGSGWSTSISRAYMALILVGYLFWYDFRHRTELLKTPIEPDFRRIRRLIALGFPAAMQFTFESGVFALTTTLIARLGAVPLAAHQIALNTVAFTYMVPLGVASAAAVRVGQAIGRKDPQGAGDAGGTAIFLGAAFMTCMSVVLLLIPRWIARAYTPDQAIIQSTIYLLAAGAAFQLFDGIQTVATGALRGLGDTRTPMLCHFTAYWIIGLPLGAWLCFRRSWGAFGLWAGLSLALILIGIVLLFVWRHRVRQLAISIPQS
jgi:MATE family multidrug resistance protein